MLYRSNLKIELREFVFSNRISPAAAVAIINILCIFKQNIASCCRVPLYRLPLPCVLHRLLLLLSSSLLFADPTTFGE